LESEELLTDRFGTKVVISDKGNKGRIEIEYVSQSDLARILDILEIKLED
jgi:ParB family chromosome partitioning protein